MTDSLPTALVTRAAGFIGSHVVRSLDQGGQVRVVALDDLSGGLQENLPSHIEFVEGSIVDTELLRRLFDEHQFQYVYHLAAYAAEGLSHFIRRFNYTNNVVGSVNLINEAVRTNVRCFVFTSSIAVYGDMKPPMREDQQPQPEDPYGIAKYAVEMDLRCAHEHFGLDYVIFRPHNVYGEFQNLGDPYRNVIGIFMRQVLTGEPMTVFGDGTQQRAFSYVGDVAPAIAEAPWVADAKNQVFNVGADVPYTVNELTGCVADVMGAAGHPVEYLPARNEVLQAWADHTKMQQVFGSQANTNLADGLARMAVWARETGVQESKHFDEIEIHRNMPPSWQRLLSQSAATLTADNS